MPERAGWTVVIPVKPASVGKSRLIVPGVEPSELARAIALDTISAAAEVAAVVVVTADAELSELDLPGVTVVREASPQGLDAAVAAGLATAAPVRRAVLLGDLPGLRPADLRHALKLAEDVPLGAVPDEERQGTTLVASRRGELPAAFGPGSWRRHLAAGFVELAIDPDSTLRRDVDLAEHLQSGLGPRTARLLDAAREESSSR